LIGQIWRQTGHHYVGERVQFGKTT
jgi:hypothetical protein